MATIAGQSIYPNVHAKYNDTMAVYFVGMADTDESANVVIGSYKQYTVAAEGSFGGSGKAVIEAQFIPDGEWHTCISTFNEAVEFTAKGSMVIIQDCTNLRARIETGTGAAITVSFTLKF